MEVRPPILMSRDDDLPQRAKLTLEGDEKESFLFYLFKKAAGSKEEMLANEDSFPHAADQHKSPGFLLMRTSGR